MKILLFIFTLTLYISPVLSQNNEVKDSLNLNWSLSGKFTFLGNQSSYSYWTAGGQTSVSGTVKIDYDFNYEKNGWNWDTKLITAYGLNSIGGSKFLKKTDDKLEINSLLGKQFTNNLIGNWSYSSFINLRHNGPKDTDLERIVKGKKKELN